MKSVLVILLVLVGLHAAVGTVEVISPVIERSTVPGVPDRVRYVRHIQYGRVGELEASPGYQAERMKRGVFDLAKILIEPPGGATPVERTPVTPVFVKPNIPVAENAGISAGTIPDTSDVPISGTPDVQIPPFDTNGSTESSGSGEKTDDTFGESMAEPDAHDGVRRRRSKMHQLPAKVIHALPLARAPGYEGRTRRSPTVGHMRPNLRAIPRGGV